MRLDLTIDPTTLTWFFLFLGSLLICFKHTLRAGWAALLIAYGMALVSSQITMMGIGWLLLTAVALLAATRSRNWKKVLAHVVFVVLGVLLFLHKLPGFNNLLIFDHVHISAGAIPFTMYLNLDKPFTGFILFTFFGAIWYKNRPTTQTLIKSIAIPLLVISIICLGTALALHFIKWDPKVPPMAWLWALNNLLLVAVCEEALFRGYLQGIVFATYIKLKPPYLPIAVAAIIFGLAHFAGGPALILLATIAGCGYGWAFYKGGILASILTHFIFNALHFFCCTYPMLG